MEKNVWVYNAQLTFPDPHQDPNQRPRRETSTTILYTADSDVAAVEDAVRFFRDRQQGVPDYFGELWCIKVGMDHIAPIDEKGHIQARHGFPFFEWKIDYPGTLRTYMMSFKMRKEKGAG